MSVDVSYGTERAVVFRQPLDDANDAVAWQTKRSGALRGSATISVSALNAALQGRATTNTQFNSLTVGRTYRLNYTVRIQGGRGSEITLSYRQGTAVFTGIHADIAQAQDDIRVSRTEVFTATSTTLQPLVEIISSNPTVNLDATLEELPDHAATTKWN